jgi:two-component system, sensor histidine kinase and response regulator
MFRYIIIFLFLIILNPILLIAQDEAAPLIEKMQRAIGVEKINMMNEISVVYRKTDRYKAMDYARQAFKLSVEDNYLPGKALAKKNEGICWFFIGNNDSAKLCYNQALEVFTRINDKKGMSACYNNMGLISQETGKYDEALKFYQFSIDIDHKLGDEIGVAATLINVADIYMYFGDAQKALLISNKYLRIYEQISDKSGLMVGFSTRGSVYDYLLLYDKAINDFTETLRLAVELSDKYNEVMAYSNLGVIYWHKGEPETAIKYLNISLGLSDETDDAYNIDNTLNTIAQIYTQQKKYIKANEILLKVLKRNDELENKRKSAMIMTSIGRNLMELNEMDKAVGYLTKSLEITVKINAKFEMLENYKNLSHANAILHNFKSADSLQDLFAETYSELYNSDSISKIKNEKTKRDVTYSTSTTSNWTIAFSLIAIFILLSVIAFHEKKREYK